MTVLDAYAVVAYLRGEPTADQVAELLREPALLPSLNAAEVFDQLVRMLGRDPDDVHADLALLTHAAVTIEWLSPEIGISAGRLRAQHYHRQRRAVSMADCVAAATALARQRPLGTSDPALAALVRDEGGDIHPLPDSSGRLP